MVARIGIVLKRTPSVSPQERRPTRVTTDGDHCVARRQVAHECPCHLNAARDVFYVFMDGVSPAMLPSLRLAVGRVKSHCGFVMTHFFSQESAVDFAAVVSDASTDVWLMLTIHEASCLRTRPG